jgi:glycosyltransferase involved in cell wall biosynthesis
MKIFYDNQVFLMQKFGGISRYFCELMKHSNGLFDYSVGGIFSNNYYACELGFHKPFFVKRNFKGKGRLLRWLNKRNSIKKLKGNCDVVHPTYYDDYLTRKIDKPLVVTVYDMIHELFPAGFTGYPNKKKLLKHSTQIIAISQNTKNDILKFHPQIPEEKISVIYLGTSWDILENYALTNENKKNYILFTGDRTFYKNFNNFIYAVAPLLEKYNLQLKCTGKPFTNSEDDLLKQQKIYDRTSIQFANEDELKELYTNALCFVFPSLYEGFGIPILEAFTCGCPLVLSNSSCFPEIAGNAGIYFEPESVDDMREKIDMVICSESLRKTLASKGFERLKAFSWRQCAEQTAKVYENCIL